MQENELLPIQYRVEFYKESVTNDPIYSFKTTSVPFSFSRGDKVDPITLGNNSLSTNSIYEVVDVIHLCWMIENSHIGHSLSVVLSTVDRTR